MFNSNLPIMKSIHLTILMLILLAAFPACNTSKRFELKGKLEGISEGKAILSGTRDDYDKSDTVLITNGEFLFTGNIPMPAEYMLTIEGKKGKPKYFYAENAKMTITGHADSLYNAKITGGKMIADEEKVLESRSAIRSKWKVDSLLNAYTKNSEEETRNSLLAASKAMEEEFEEFQLDFVRQNPASYYSALIVERWSFGRSSEEIEKYLNLLDPKLNDFHAVVNLRNLVENLKITDVDITDFTSKAPDVGYTVDTTFHGAAISNMVYLATFPDDNICGLRNDRTICLFSNDGTSIGAFKSTLTAKPSALAIDQSNGRIYVLGTKTTTREMTVRGKEYKIEEQVGVECMIYNAVGTEMNRMDLPELKSATGAKIINNKLIVADYKSRMVAVYDLEKGKMESGIQDLRVCCNILDFGVSASDELLVANLGAFRVNAFDLKGDIKYAFGRRGQTINDFHGCCNPVNVAVLSSGAIVTVEKDPTRIKVYNKSGASQISGIEELVTGCRYIPLTTDSRDNIYLASAQSGIIKCSPVMTPVAD